MARVCTSWILEIWVTVCSSQIKPLVIIKYEKSYSSMQYYKGGHIYYRVCVRHSLQVSDFGFYYLPTTVVENKNMMSQAVNFCVAAQSWSTINHFMMRKPFFHTTNITSHNTFSCKWKKKKQFLISYRFAYNKANGVRELYCQRLSMSQHYLLKYKAGSWDLSIYIFAIDTHTCMYAYIT